MAKPPPEVPQGPAAKVRKLFQDNIGVWQPYYDAIDREERFLDGERYERDNGPENRDRRLTQIRGQEIQDTIRDFAAEATARPRSVDARPVDSDGDPDIAEVELALIDQELRNPWKGFESRYYEAILDSRERRLGILWMDWEPGFGPFGGEIFFRTIDPRRVMWEPGYDPHHPLCGWLLERRRCDVDWIHASYPGSAWVKPDHAAISDDGRRLREGVAIVQGAGGHQLLPNLAVRDNKAELWFCWYKNDRTPAYRDTGQETVLPPEQRYMSCANGCGYRSPTQGDLLKQGKLETGLPPSIDGCPDCAAKGQSGTLTRIDVLPAREAVFAYPRGRRLVVVAPFSPPPSADAAVYDGKWPIPRARSFPGLFLMSYLSPRRAMGKSDVTLMWDQQVAADNLRTMALQRVFEHRNYWELPAVGMTDVRGGRFAFRDDQFNVMYRDATKAAMGPLDVHVHSGSGLDATGWQLAFQATQEALVRYRPIVDFGLTPNNTKQLAVGTIERLTQQGKIPIEEYNRRKNHELSKFYGVVSDYIHATYTPQRLSRLNLDGIELLAKIWGQDMPNFDFVVEESPEFTGLEKARSEAFDALMRVIPTAAQLGLPADRLIELFADINNIPRSVVRKFQKELEAAKNAAGSGTAPGAAPGAGEATLPAMNPDLSGAGMVPAPVG